MSQDEKTKPDAASEVPPAPTKRRMSSSIPPFLRNAPVSVRRTFKVLAALAALIAVLEPFIPANYETAKAVFSWVATVMSTDANSLPTDPGPTGSP